MFLLPDELEDLIPDSVFFLWWLTRLSNSVGPVAPPPLKVFFGIYKTADFVAYHLAENMGDGYDMATPAILAYEHSALGSTRII